MNYASTYIHIHNIYIYMYNFAILLTNDNVNKVAALPSLYIETKSIL